MLFSLVGRIVRNGTYCSADTNWKSRCPGQDYEVPFPEIKAKLSIEAIPHPGLEEAFEESIKCLRMITNANNVAGKLDIFCGNPKFARSSIPLSHSFFEPLNKEGSKYPEVVFEWLDTMVKRGKCTYIIISDR
jgi:hypothetical protein